MTPQEGIPLDRFLTETLREYPKASGVFVDLMQSIALAGKLISSRVNRAGLSDMLGATGVVNVQGERVQKLDTYANDVFIRALEHRGHTCMIVSEEEGGVVRVPEQWHSGRYVVAVDPLDGSSNIDVNATIGTIFAIFRRLSPEGTPADDADALRPGTDQVAAGYILYGAGTVLVLATEQGVHGFTLDPQVGEFFLSHPDIRMAQDARIFSINEAYARKWTPGVREYVESCKDEAGWTGRYIGSLVADFHRNLLHGGVFLYPGTIDSPQGKLRLLYEAFPLAYIAERAGGAATDGRDRILDIVPTALHDRTPLVIGCARAVEAATRAMSDASA